MTVTATKAAVESATEVETDTAVFVAEVEIKARNAEAAIVVLTEEEVIVVSNVVQSMNHTTVVPSQVRIEAVKMSVCAPGIRPTAASATGFIGTESVSEVAVPTKNIVQADLVEASNS